MNEDVVNISKQLDYLFNNQELLLEALTHRSAGKNNNERLEFLGDAILGFVIADLLYQRFPQAEEGLLTRLRASLVKRETLAKVGREAELGTLIKLGTGERKSGGWRRDSILANTVEALLGAIYLDSDLNTCRQVIIRLFQSRLDDVSLEQVEKDAKTTLQEFLQQQHFPLPVYEILDEEGEPHKRIFTVSCCIDNLEKKVVAQGRSRRIAEQNAAKMALELIQAMSANE